MSTPDSDPVALVVRKHALPEITEAAHVLYCAALCNKNIPAYFDEYLDNRKIVLHTDFLATLQKLDEQSRLVAAESAVLHDGLLNNPYDRDVDGVRWNLWQTMLLADCELRREECRFLERILHQATTDPILPAFAHALLAVERYALAHTTESRLIGSLCIYMVQGFLDRAGLEGQNGWLSEIAKATDELRARLDPLKDATNSGTGTSGLKTGGVDTHDEPGEGPPTKRTKV